MVEPAVGMTEEPADDKSTINAYAIDNLFLFLAAILVLFMQAGSTHAISGIEPSIKHHKYSV